MNASQPDFNRGEEPLSSWKEIGAYLQRNAATVRRWEKEEGLPVHRHSHNSRSSVYAYPSEIDAWRASRKVIAEAAPGPVSTFWRIPTFALAILLCLIMVGNGVRPQTASAKDGPVARRLICSDCGNGDGRLSRDGRFMVFPDWSSGDLAIRDMATGKDRRLMVKTGGYETSDAEVEDTVISPDHRQILYVWWTGKKDDRSQLRLTANEPGSKSRVVLEGHEYWTIDWFPDGKSVLIILNKPDRTSQLARMSLPDGAVKVLKPLEWRLARVGPDPRLSPDGQYIVYAARAVNPSKFPPQPSDPRDVHIYLMAADGSRETEIVKTAGVNNNPVWTAAGKHILFTGDRTGQFDLWSVAVSDGKLTGPETLVHRGIGDIWALGIQAGSYIYMVRQRGADYVNIADMRPGARPSQSFVGIIPTWSPDGKSLAFKRHRPGSGSGAYDLVVHSLETGDEKIYGLGTTGGNGATWFHDGKSVMTGQGSLPNGAPDAFYRIGVGTGEFKEVTTIMGGNALSPDDKTLYVAPLVNGSAHEIFAVDVASGQSRRILARENMRPSLGLSPDGRTLAMSWLDPASPADLRWHIGLVSTDGSNFREIFSRKIDGPKGIGNALHWSKDARSILFTQEQPGGANLAVVQIPVDGGSRASVVFTADGLGPLFALSPDGSRIAYSSSKGSNEVWALDNVLPMLK